MLLKTGADLFVQIPDGSSERFLYRAQVVAIAESGYVVALRANLFLQVADELLVYFDAECEFVQQPARISALLPNSAEPEGLRRDKHTIEAEPSDPMQMICLETLADPISAENRRDYRIHVASSDVRATLDGEKCAVDDVSATGFAILSNRPHERGTLLPASIRYGDQEHWGRICIRSIREAGSQLRYGVSYVAEPGGRSELAKGLRAIVEALPREDRDGTPTSSS